MTLFDVNDLTAYWVDHPPLHILVAAYVGFGQINRNQTKSTAMSAPHPGSAALCAALGPGFAVASVHAGLAPVVLDIAELRRRTTG